MKKHTPLYEMHHEYKATFVDFAGWQLPLHYGSPQKEHLAVRSAAGVFDVSHMNIVDLLGAGCRNFLRYLLANDVDKLIPGKAIYSCLLNHHGGILDDLIVYMCDVDKYRLVLNAATRQHDLSWIQQHANGLGVGLQERPEFAMLAVQGPTAIATVMQVISESQQLALKNLKPFHCKESDDLFIARTGYTGEDGVEIIIPQERAAILWQSLVEKGVKPAGLAARNSLRLEAGLLLYGGDMNETTTPLESALEWTVAWDPIDRDFIGRSALELQKSQGVKRRLVGLVSSDPAIMRANQIVKIQQKEEGIITSGGYSPTLKCSIALARIPVIAGSTPKFAEVLVRDKWITAKVTEPRFVKK